MARGADDAALVIPSNGSVDQFDEVGLPAQTCRPSARRPAGGGAGRDGAVRARPLRAAGRSHGFPRYDATSIHALGKCYTAPYLNGGRSAPRPQEIARVRISLCRDE